MTKEVLYLYLGTNGTILSPVHLEDVYYTRQIKLIADSGKILTNGKKRVPFIIVPEEKDLAGWEEVPLAENE